MSNYSVIIDNRETLLKEYFSKLNTNSIFKFENLEIGDIIFKLNNEIVLIIERKTINDLYSSIKDGRYKEQKQRLVSNYSKDKIMYLIENSINEQKQKYKYNTDIIYGSIVNVLLRDNIKILRSDSIKESIKFIEIIIKRLETKPEMFNLQPNSINSINASTETYLSSIKLSKKQNMTPENCQIVQLAQIPGVSVNYAKTILEKYSKIKNLIMEYDKIDEIPNKELLLENIIITTTNNKTRKLGKVLSKRIFEYIY